MYIYCNNKNPWADYYFSIIVDNYINAIKTVRRPYFT